MNIQDASIKKSHIVKRVRIIRRYRDVIIKPGIPGRIFDWMILALFLLCISPLIYMALLPSGGIDLFGKVLLSLFIAVPLGVVFFGVLAHGWSLLLKTDDEECVFRRTYLWCTTHTVHVSLANGNVGPFPVRIQWEELPQARYEGAVSAIMFVLGPLGMLIGGLIHTAHKKIMVANDYPGIVHFDPTTDSITPLLTFEDPTLRDRVLAAFADVAPDIVATE